MKFRVLYDTRISTKLYKKGDEIEFIDGTDELFIKRLIDIKCIEPINEGVKPKQQDKRGTNVKKTKNEPKEADDLGVDLDDIEE
ncbi:hypothetical protein [Campylobacter mucosalis]|uniref:Uncharacterized protein n=1 Tax=Campylobacter mucosalis CCUG 21559 TaxID=1032067 RepID=A0A6G5QFS3_9BACT|nr:hypothetical protein [Campylobacter mucosalis]QCD44449.1 hypothetical protein CMUC_0650 [Campylobacter mucosalis CCUG 21559]